MPAALTYLAIMLAVIIVWFLLLKRPVYEAVLISFIILLTITGTWGHVGGYIDTGLKTSLLYSMTAFCAMSILLTKRRSSTLPSQSSLHSSAVLPVVLVMSL